MDANGHVANYVETEMVHNANSVTSLECRYTCHAPCATGMVRKLSQDCMVFDSQVLQAGRHQVSYVMVRGSVPVYWTQPGFSTAPHPSLRKVIQSYADAGKQ